jgi:nucleotide-binding universal stress UspA family protein
MTVRPSKHPGTVTLEMHRFDEALLEKAQRQTQALAIRKILVPVDFSPFSYKSLDYATAFALQSKAEILLLHVVPINYVDADLIAFDYTELERQTAETAKIQLERLAAERVDPAVTRYVRVGTGKPADEIVRIAEEFQAELIVIATHGYTGFKHAFLGSTTEKVVRSAPCPVLTLRQHEHDFIPSPPKRD